MADLSAVVRCANFGETSPPALSESAGRVEGKPCEGGKVGATDEGVAGLEVGAAEEGVDAAVLTVNAVPGAA
jgi:hypothetical protein